MWPQVKDVSRRLYLTPKLIKKATQYTPSIVLSPHLQHKNEAIAVIAVITSYLSVLTSVVKATMEPFLNGRWCVLIGHLFHIFSPNHQSVRTGSITRN